MKLKIKLYIDVVKEVLFFLLDIEFYNIIYYWFEWIFKNYWEIELLDEM